MTLWTRGDSPGEFEDVFDPEVLAGKPVIRGTRLTVEFILERTYRPCASPPAGRLSKPILQAWLPKAQLLKNRLAAGIVANRVE